ncbi:MAG TPA: hypothetical protein VE978_23705 [Chitinophagales bacterium]|nr:hypothetical protein [Chitinophagales bacterium]
MVVERTKDEVIIRLPSKGISDEVQDFLDYLIFMETTSKSKAKKKDIDRLVKDIKKGWWKKNRSRLIR